MGEFEVYLAYVAWGNDGKVRPVLILEKHPAKESTYLAFSITTKYKKKSEHIRKNYLKIKDWKELQLSQVSYIDMNKRIDVHEDDITVHKGVLSDRDIRRVAEKLED